jgi:spore germination protein KB
MNKTDRISSPEFFLFMICYTLSYSRILSFADSSSRQDSWLVLIVSFLFSLPFVMIYAALLKRFPAKNMLQIFRIVFGKAAGTVISVLYIVYFTLVLSHMLNDMSEFFTSYIEPETPPMLFIVITILTAAYGLKTGIQYLVKMSGIIALLSAVSVFVPFLLLLSKMDFTNFLPVLRYPPKIYFQSFTQFWHLQTNLILFPLMLTPRLQFPRSVGKSTLRGIAAGTLGLLLIIVRNTAVLGPMAAVVDSASYASTRVIEVGNVFTRVEIVVSLITTILIFLSISVVYFSAAEGVSQLFRIKFFPWAILPIGAAATVLAMVFFPSTVEHLEYAKNYNVPLYSAFGFVFPPAALIAAKLRRLREDAPPEAKPENR